MVIKDETLRNLVDHLSFIDEDNFHNIIIITSKKYLINIYRLMITVLDLK